MKNDVAFPSETTHWAMMVTGTIVQIAEKQYTSI